MQKPNPNVYYTEARSLTSPVYLWNRTEQVYKMQETHSTGQCDTVQESTAHKSVYIRI